jgi:haloalkane dehalogenase
MAFPRDIPVGRNHPSAAIMHSILERRNLIRDKSKVIIWGLQDPVFPRYILDSWLNAYPGTETHELPEASHFLQEDAPDKIVNIIQRFLSKTGIPTKSSTIKVGRKPAKQVGRKR